MYLASDIIINSCVKNEYPSLLENEGFLLILESENDLRYQASNVVLEFNYDWRDGLDVNILAGENEFLLLVIMFEIWNFQGKDTEKITASVFPNQEQVEEMLIYFVQFLRTEGKPLLIGNMKMITEASKIKLLFSSTKPEQQEYVELIEENNRHIQKIIEFFE
jgi:hypothetical protein